MTTPTNTEPPAFALCDYVKQIDLDGQDLTVISEHVDVGPYATMAEYNRAARKLEQQQTVVRGDGPVLYIYHAHQVLYADAADTVNQAEAQAFHDAEHGRASYVGIVNRDTLESPPELRTHEELEAANEAAWDALLDAIGNATKTPKPTAQEAVDVLKAAGYLPADFTLPETEDEE